jgi:hypothetical protein
MESSHSCLPRSLATMPARPHWHPLLIVLGFCLGFQTAFAGYTPFIPQVFFKFFYLRLRLSLSDSDHSSHQSWYFLYDPPGISPAVPVTGAYFYIQSSRTLLTSSSFLIQSSVS